MNDFVVNLLGELPRTPSRRSSHNSLAVRDVVYFLVDTGDITVALAAVDYVLVAVYSIDVVVASPSVAVVDRLHVGILVRRVVLCSVYIVGASTTADHIAVFSALEVQCLLKGGAIGATVAVRTAVDDVLAGVAIDDVVALIAKYCIAGPVRCDNVVASSCIYLIVVSVARYSVWVVGA